MIQRMNVTGEFDTSKRSTKVTEMDQAESTRSGAPDARCDGLEPEGMSCGIGESYSGRSGEERRYFDLQFHFPIEIKIS